MDKIKQMGSQNILVTGISGQDGLFLTKYLLSDINASYKIFGVSRQNSNSIIKNLKSIGSATKNLQICNIDLTNPTETLNVLNQIKPFQIFNLSGPSSVYDSLKNGEYYKFTINTIFDNLINSCIEINHFPTFFQACSSEMFSKNNLLPLNEKSELKPRSPYAIAKFEVFSKVNELKVKFDWNIKSGIMFNHESEFRSKDYLFNKIFSSVKQIHNKELDNFEVGSLDLRRDWSFAGDFAQAMISINQSSENNNYVVGSGVSTSIKEIVEKVFSLYKLNLDNHIKINPNLLRKDDPIEVVSDPQLLKSNLNWKPTHNIDMLLERIFKRFN